MAEPTADLEVLAATAADAEAIVAMARALAAAAAVGDPPPRLTPEGLVRCLAGPDPWGECLLAMRPDRAVGYALVCRGSKPKPASGACGSPTCWWMPPSGRAGPAAG